MEKVLIENALKKICAVDTVSLANAGYLALVTTDGVPSGHVNASVLTT